jgi:CO/xanthine dehydrogenase Mo-binding subunit
LQGSNLIRADGYAKVTGRERYAADEYPEGLVYAGVVRSPHPHARICSIDSTAALSCPGIIAVLTSNDINGKNRVGLPEMDQPVLADDKVRFIGDPVVLVLTETKEQLPRAIASVHVTYEPLSAVFNPDDSLRAGSPVLHENRKKGNLLFAGEIKKGNITVGFKECAYVQEGTFLLPRQEHAYLETETGVARVDDNGVLRMVVSTQTPFRDAREISEALGIQPEKIRVIAPYLGGAFGGKDGITVQGLLALGALHAGGRPVKIWNTREESFISSTKRHPGEITLRLGCLPDGTLHALFCRIIFDTGAYAGLGGPILVYAMGHAAGIYRITHTQVEGVSVYTNNPVSGAFRGFGIPQVVAALEQVVDMLADSIGMDPLEFRLKNAVKEGDITGLGVQMSTSTGIIPCLERVRSHPFWTGRHEWIREAPLYRRRGVGIAAAGIGIGYGPVIPDYAGAKIELLSDGRFRIYAGVVDMGQGNNPTNIRITGNILGQSSEQFDLIQPDTFQCLPSCSSAGSRTTYTYGNALILASGILKERILKQVMHRNPEFRLEDLRLIPGGVLHVPDGEVIALQQIAENMPEQERIAVATWTAPVNTQDLPVTPEMKIFGFPHLVYSFTAHCVRIEIDELTGEVKTDAYLACTDAGRILNPQVYEQQVQGAVIQGIGYALFEDFQIQEGTVATRNLSTYILPTALDVPDIISVPVETIEKTGPFGLKGVGEIGITAPLPCIANAVAKAIGQRIYQVPLTPERILSAIRGAG